MLLVADRFARGCAPKVSHAPYESPARLPPKNFHDFSHTGFRTEEIAIRQPARGPSAQAPARPSQAVGSERKPIPNRILLLPPTVRKDCDPRGRAVPSVPRERRTREKTAEAIAYRIRRLVAERFSDRIVTELAHKNGLSRSHGVTEMHENETGTAVADRAVHLHQDLRLSLCVSAPL